MMNSLRNDKRSTCHTRPSANFLNDVAATEGPLAEPAADPKFRQRQVDRAIAALYRWYVAKSQPRRNWNPDTSFNWREIRQDLPPDILRIVQGFYAVEQFVPDYAGELVRLLRKDYGRSQFYLKWGSEESRHADLWQNVMLATGYRSLEQVEEYSRELRQRSWQLPFDDQLEMLVYTVFQERATQVNYANLKTLVSNREDAASFDPVLALACGKIATDEVAHFEFFLSATLLYLYYFPERTLNAISRVLTSFEMPAAQLVDDYSEFIDALYRHQVFGKKTYYKEVVRLVCERFAVRDLKALSKGPRQSQSDDGTAHPLPLTPQRLFDFETIQTSIITLFIRLGRFERDCGIDNFFQTGLIPHVWEER